jgi:hypothetical protein
MRYYIYFVFISLFFFQICKSAANTPTSKPKCTNDQLNNDMLDLGEESAMLISSSIDIQEAMKVLFGTLSSCRERMRMFIKSIGGKSKFKKYLKKTRATIGDESNYNMNCDYPYNNIITKLQNASPLDGLHMNKVHLEIINEENERLSNSIIYFQNEMSRNSKVEDQ